jgi:drug/metabolite transporter (DMT)-like permease
MQRMSRMRVAALTLLAMLAFAGNSLLCRMALKHTTIDPASFTSIRIVSGAAVLWLIAGARPGTGAAAGRGGPTGNWVSAFALFVYAAAFSFSYVSLSAATGALLLFGAVQATMIGCALWAGERLRLRQGAGLALALSGLVGLLLPGLAAPPLTGSLLMLAAGVAWAIYSLRGKGAGDPLRVTGGNFQRAVVPALALGGIMIPWATLDRGGVGYALASGTLASGLGYAIWYTALPGMSVTSAATAQLSVPVIAAIGGVVLLDEPMTLRLAVAALAILGGIALVLIDRSKAN